MSDVNTANTPNEISTTNGEYDLDLDLAPKRCKVRLSGHVYILQEASEDAVCQYRSEAMKGREILNHEDGTFTVRSIGGVAKLQPLLVSLCLVKTNNGEMRFKTDKVTPDCVPLNEVLTWKNSTVETLFDKIKSMSPGLVEVGGDRESLLKMRNQLDRQLQRLDEEDSRLKKLQDSTTDTSDSPTT